MSIAQDIIDAVRERVSFVDIASSYVNLKQSGRTFKGLCPFHSEKTPSFHINDEDKYYHCFGCGKKGSVFDFVMEMRGFSFPEAVRYLGSVVGIEVPETRSRGEREAGKQRSKKTAVLRELVAETALLYSEQLRDSRGADSARRYLEERGVRQSSIETFSLGFAPDDWRFLHSSLFARCKDKLQGLKEDTLSTFLLELGLLKEKSGSNAKPYDAFRARLVFPIWRSDGRAIAFGARRLGAEDKGPKYLNSPESPVYSKRKAFYGLPQALGEMRKTRHAYLVEGYLDVISLHQLGVSSSVAGCGTAITTEQAQILGRLVDRVTLLFDGDAAGRKAAGQCFEVFLNSGVDVHAVLLPEGEDPDSFARTHSILEFDKMVRDSRVPVVKTYVDSLMAGSPGEGGEEPLAARSGRVARRFASVVAKVKNPVEREVLCRSGAEFLGVSEAAIENLITGAFAEEQQRAKVRSQSPVTYSPPPVAEAPPEESHFVQLTEDEPEEVVVEFHTNVEAVERTLDAVSRQLLIAVISEPGLCAHVREMSVVVEGVGPAELLEPGLQAFVQELSEADVIGVSHWSREDLSDFELQSKAALADLIAKHNLSSFGLIEEARRQSQVGGTQPKEVVKASERALSERVLKQEVKNIRSQENNSADGKSLEVLAQEKLLKKRRLHRLGSVEE